MAKAIKSPVRWGIQTPKGRALGYIYMWETYAVRSDAIATAEADFGEKWKTLYRDGFRVIKVRIVNA